MTNARHLPADTSKLAVLVNQDRLRSSIKRLFSNQIDEVLSELFQNSQRSNSTLVEITTTENSVTIQDNGHGLIDGIGGFHTLLKLAESNFENETIVDQDPMGLGIVSLLTHDQVSEVTFTSGSLQLSIETARWWNDSDYYSTWFERLKTLDQQITGLRITVSCLPEFVKSVQKSLTAKDRISYGDSIFQCASPAQGYGGILDITLDGQPVRTSLPLWTKLIKPLISTVYKGCKLEVGYAPSRLRSSVLWYGQLIIQPRSLDDFHFHLEVKSGRPINPKSPTRAGIIQDAAYAELIEFIKTNIFKFIFDPQNRSKITPAQVEACYKIDPTYSVAHCPYIVAEPIRTSEFPSSFEEFDGTADFFYDRVNINEFFTYDQLPQLLNDEVIVQFADKSDSAEYGLQSFLSQTGSAYSFVNGDVNRVPIGTLWWKPEGTPKHETFYRPGDYGISYEPDAPPPVWTPITTKTVFVFNDTSSYDANEVDFIVGTTEEPVEFYRNDAWAGFSPHDDSDHDPQEESYRETLNDIIRSLIGNCVPKDFKLYEIARFLKDPAAPIVEIKYHFKHDGRFVNPRRAYKSKCPGGMDPAEITVKTSTGERIRLKLY